LILEFNTLVHDGEKEVVGGINLKLGSVVADV